MYREFFQYMESTLSDNLTQVKAIPLADEVRCKVARRGSKEAIIYSFAFESQNFRRIRCTLIEGFMDVLNCVWYPRQNVDLPLFGCDLMTFHREGKAPRHVSVIDITPLANSPAYEARYLEPVAPIYQRHRHLAQEREYRFYDKGFFSKYHLLANPSTEQVSQQILTAFKDYLAIYFELVALANHLPPLLSPTEVREAQRHYDQHHLERDPAIPFFKGWCGEEWTEGYVHDFLFEL